MVKPSIARGDVWWADLDEPVGSAPGYRRPIVVVQANAFNARRIETIVVSPLTGNLTLAQHAGNVLIDAREAGLGRDSVLLGLQTGAVDRNCLTDWVGSVPEMRMAEVDSALRLILDL